MFKFILVSVVSLVYTISEGEPVWLNVGKIWWPGYVKAGVGTFWGEEDEIE